MSLSKEVLTARISRLTGKMQRIGAKLPELPVTAEVKSEDGKSTKRTFPKITAQKVMRRLKKRLNRAKTLNKKAKSA